MWWAALWDLKALHWRLQSNSWRKKRKTKKETFLLPADFFLTSMMRSRKDVEEDSWQRAAWCWAGGSTVLGHVTCSDPATFSAGCVKKDSSAKWGNKDAPQLLLQLLRRRFPGKTDYSTAARVKQRYVWKIRGTQTRRLAGAGPQAAARHRPPLQVSTQYKRLKRILSV